MAGIPIAVGIPIRAGAAIPNLAPEETACPGSFIMSSDRYRVGAELIQT